MTSVRRPAAEEPTKRGRTRAPAKKSAAPGGSSLAQVRLRADEMAVLREAMKTLQLKSTSDALREGIRLLTREAAEVAAAEEIRAFYGTEIAPLPDGVVPPTDDELAGADNAQW